MAWNGNLGGVYLLSSASSSIEKAGREWRKTKQKRGWCYICLFDAHLSVSSHMYLVIINRSEEIASPLSSFLRFEKWLREVFDECLSLSSPQNFHFNGWIFSYRNELSPASDETKSLASSLFLMFPMMLMTAGGHELGKWGQAWECQDRKRREGRCGLRDMHDRVVILDVKGVATMRGQVARRSQVTWGGRRAWLGVKSRNWPEASTWPDNL